MAGVVFFASVPDCSTRIIAVRRTGGKAKNFREIGNLLPRSEWLFCNNA